MQRNASSVGVRRGTQPLGARAQVGAAQPGRAPARAEVARDRLERLRVVRLRHHGAHRHRVRAWNRSRLLRGTLMRHFLLSRPIAALTRRVGKPPTVALLITSAGSASRAGPCALYAPLSAIALTAVAAHADHTLASARGAVVQTGGRFHRQLFADESAQTCGAGPGRRTILAVAVRTARSGTAPELAWRFDRVPCRSPDRRRLSTPNPARCHPLGCGGRAPNGALSRTLQPR